MKIIKINPNNPHPKALDEAVKVLANGGTLVYPTDTCYGLGADMTNIIAVDKIYKIKKRSDSKPLSVIAKNISAIKRFSLLEEAEEKILRKYFPGAITFVLLNLDYKIFPQTTVGVRIPEFKITQLIADKLYKPYATTSANLAGKNVCYNINDFLTQIRKNQYQPDLILDAGQLPIKPPSTVVNLIRRPYHIIRHGSVKFTDAT